MEPSETFREFQKYTERSYAKAREEAEKVLDPTSARGNWLDPTLSTDKWRVMPTWEETHEDMKKAWEEAVIPPVGNLTPLLQKALASPTIPVYNSGGIIPQVGGPVYVQRHGVTKDFTPQFGEAVPMQDDEKKMDTLISTKEGESFTLGGESVAIRSYTSSIAGNKFTITSSETLGLKRSTIKVKPDGSYECVPHGRSEYCPHINAIYKTGLDGNEFPWDRPEFHVIVDFEQERDAWVHFTQVDGSPSRKVWVRPADPDLKLIRTGRPSVAPSVPVHVGTITRGDGIGVVAGIVKNWFDELVMMESMEGQNNIVCQNQVHGTPQWTVEVRERRMSMQDVINNKWWIYFTSWCKVCTELCDFDEDVPRI